MGLLDNIQKKISDATNELDGKGTAKINEWAEKLDNKVEQLDQKLDSTSTKDDLNEEIIPSDEQPVPIPKPQDSIVYYPAPSDSLVGKELDSYLKKFKGTEKLTKHCQYNSETDELVINQHYFFIKPEVLKLGDVYEYFLISDGHESTHFSMGAAAGGAILTGGIGTLAGFMMPKKKTKVSQVGIQLNTLDEQTFHTIVLLNLDTNTKSSLYKDAIKEADNILHFLNHEFHLRSLRTKKLEKSNVSTSQSTADELKKLANLRDEGILSDSEFEQQKQKLLNN